MFSFLFSLFIQISNADIRISSDVILTGEKNDIVDADINPSNQVFKLPIEEYDLDVRGEWKWRSRSSLVMIRPKWLGKYQKIPLYTDNTETHYSKGQLDLTDAFVENKWLSTTTTTTGLQVYQWGPAEFMNASNPFFHFNTKQKSLYYKEKGQALVRLNYSINKLNSIVIAVEPVSNNEPEWMEGESFYPKSIIKYEKSWKGSFDSVGIVAGVERKNGNFVGEYFSYYPTDGFSIYTDIKHPLYKYNYAPVYNGASYDMSLIENNKNQFQTIGVMGLRYEGDFDFRLEYIYNSAGYDKQTMLNARDSASNFFSVNYQQNLKRYIKPGLEMMGQQYAYSSIRVTDPFKIRDFNVYSRYVFSLQDSSSQLQFEIEKAFADSFNWFLSETSYFGINRSEFRQTNTWLALLGLKWSI